MVVVIMLGFNEERTIEILKNPDVKKLVIFDENEDYRSNFINLHKIHNDRITFYDGDIDTNLHAYLKYRSCGCLVNVQKSDNTPIGVKIDLQVRSSDLSGHPETVMWV